MYRGDPFVFTLQITRRTNCFGVFIENNKACVRSQPLQQQPAVPATPECAVHEHALAHSRYGMTRLIPLASGREGRIDKRVDRCLGQDRTMYVFHKHIQKENCSIPSDMPSARSWASRSAHRALSHNSKWLTRPI